MSKSPIYLDYQATTPLDDRVLDAMMPYLTGKFGNPHSASHRFGWEAEAALDIAREQVATEIGGEGGDLVFTSGATEANNMAVKGLFEAFAPSRNEIVLSDFEHSCVLKSAEWLAENRGAVLRWVPVGRDGRLDLSALKAAVSDKTALVSVMMVNNEIGTVQDMAAISRIVRDVGAVLHSDCAQAFGKIAIDVGALGIDLLSLSGHKIYGPKGVGALWMRGDLAVKPGPLLHGGGQEQGLRSGTQAPALVAGLGRAADIAGAERAQETDRLAKMRTRFLDRVMEALPDTQMNGSIEHRVPGNLNLCFPGARADLLLSGLRSVAVSSGSACASGSGRTSHVLRAIGLSDDAAKSSLRIGFGRFTKDEEMDYAAAALIETVKACRR